MMMARNEGTDIGTRLKGLLHGRLMESTSTGNRWEVSAT